ncbi:MAG: peptidoglycan-binding domain-containing protein, partial [Gammaproteobacteria bacterium]|nr:peptidoglycan-binding domain-containing protein [Gammaproteobacteria bacterium]
MRRHRRDWFTGALASAGVLTASASLAADAPVAARPNATTGTTHLLAGTSPGLGLLRGSSRAAPLLFTALAAAQDAAVQDAAAIEKALGLDRPARRLIQLGLRNAGFDPGPPDGLFGPRTRAALTAWQAAGEHAETGYLVEAQAEALRAAGTARTVALECSAVPADQEWAILVEALAHAVGAFRAEFAKLDSERTQLNGAQPDRGNELDTGTVQCALLRLRLGTLQTYGGEERRLLEVDAFLASAHAKFHELREHARGTEIARIEEVGRNLHDLLRNRYPNGPLNAVLRVGMVVADVSNDGHRRLERAGGGVRARPAWVVSWGTRPPWRWYRPRVGGGFGYEA